MERSRKPEQGNLINKDDRSFRARDIVAKNIHEQNMRENKKTTYEQAERKASEIAEKVRRESR